MKALRRILVIFACAGLFPIAALLGIYTLFIYPFIWVILGNSKANIIEPILFKYMNFIMKAK